MKLSKKQEEVMKWINGGWELRQSHGMAFEVNGKHVCNLDTVTVLERLGLIRKTSQWTWGRAPAQEG